MSKLTADNIRLRAAVPTDIPSIATLLASAPDDGSKYQFPHILEYAGDMVNLHMKWLCHSMRDEEALIMLAIASSEHGGETVVGYSCWIRKETSKEQGSIRNISLRQCSWSEYDVKTFKNKNLVMLVKMVAEEQFLADLEAKMKSDPPSIRTKALTPNTARQQAISRRRKLQPSNPLDNIAGFELSGLAIHDKYQGRGIGSALVRWGMDRAASEKVPVFATGEARGVGFYEKAMRFQKIAGSEYWLDKNGKDVSEDEVGNGSTAWTTEEEGLTGAHVLWLPDGLSIL